MRRGRMAAAVLVAVLAAAGCGDDGDSDSSATTEPADGSTTSVAPSPSDGPEGDQATPLGTATHESVDAAPLGELPAPPGNAVSTTRPPFAGWDGAAVLVGPAGGLVRFGPEGGVEVSATDGIDVGEPGVSERVVDTLAADGETLLAIGHQEELVADVIPTTFPYVWRSADGETWEGSTPDGLESGTDEVEVRSVVAHPDGGWLAGGQVDDGNQTTLMLWSSEDGESWTAVDAPGLDETDTEETSERLVSLAVIDDTVLVVREAIGLDDSALTLLRSDGDGGFTALEPTGLDELDLPNTDIIPGVTAVADLFVMLASVPTEDGEEFGERTPALFTSPDGETWETTELDGPLLPDPYFVQAITATDSGAVAVAEGVNGLDVWRFTDD